MAKPPQAKTLPTWDDCHYVGDDGKVNKVTIRGELLTWKALQQPIRHKPEAKRGNVTTFSKAARLRMLSFIATIGWQKALPGLFLTCTYPDSVCIERREQLNMHRALFWRYIEKWLQGPKGALWRIEWKARLSGEKIGEWYPHYHFLIFNVDFLSIERIQTCWKQSISSTEIPICWIEKIESGSKAGIYVAKYQSKDDSSLDNVAYHNSVPGGRNWGILRKAMIPLEKGIMFRIAETDQISELRNAAAATRKTGVILPNESFKLIGPYAQKIIEFFVNSDLPREDMPD